MLQGCIRDFVSLPGLGLTWREKFEANTKAYGVMQKQCVTTLATSMSPAQKFGVSDTLVVHLFVTELVFVLCFYQTYLQILFLYVGNGVLGVGMGKPKLSFDSILYNSLQKTQEKLCTCELHSFLIGSVLRCH